MHDSLVLAHILESELSLLGTAEIVKAAGNRQSLGVKIEKKLISISLRSRITQSSAVLCECVSIGYPENRLSSVKSDGQRDVGFRSVLINHTNETNTSSNLEQQIYSESLYV